MGGWMIMFNLSFIACSFHFQKLHSRESKNICYLNDNIEVKKEDNDELENIKVKKLFNSFFSEYACSVNDQNSQKIFSCEHKEFYCGDTEAFSYLYTIINSGIYGSRSDIIDIDTNQVIHKKKSNEADVRPFYLYIVIPKDNEDVKVQKGLLFFQNIGPFGVKTITTSFMIDYFSKKYGLSFKLKTVSSDLFIKKIVTKENIKQLIMTRNHVSDDRSDRINNGYGEETRVIGKLFYNETAWDKIMNSIRYCSKGKYNIFEFENIKYDTLKVRVSIGDRERTIDLHNLENLSIVEGIPDEIKMADGHPKADELLVHFQKVANEYLSEMVLQIN